MDRDGVDLAVVDAHADETSKTFTRRSTSPQGGTVDWVGGLYYFNDKYSQRTFYAFKLGFAPLPANSYLVQDMPNYDTEPMRPSATPPGTSPTGCG